MYYLGFFKTQKNVDWSQVTRLVFLCHGNICRSPLGECYAKLLGVNTISCGLHCQDGFNADPRAIDYARQLELDMTSHKTTNINRVKLSKGDLIVAMEPKHIDALKHLEIMQAQCTLAGLWLGWPRPYIHDPFSVNEEYFSVCERLVVEATGGIVENTQVR